MKDPNITQVLRALEKEERDSITKDGVNFADYDFNIAFLLQV